MLAPLVKLHTKKSSRWLGGAPGKGEDDGRFLWVKCLLTLPEMEVDGGRMCNSGEESQQPGGAMEGENTGKSKRGSWGLYRTKNGKE